MCGNTNHTLVKANKETLLEITALCVETPIIITNTTCGNKTKHLCV